MSDEELYEDIDETVEEDIFDIQGAKTQATREAAGLAEGEEYGEDDENPDEYVEPSDEDVEESDVEDVEEPTDSDEEKDEGEKKEEAPKKPPREVPAASFTIHPSYKKTVTSKSGEEYEYDYTRLVYETPGESGTSYAIVPPETKKMFYERGDTKPYSLYSFTSKDTKKSTLKGVSLSDTFTTKDAKDSSTFAFKFVNALRSYVSDSLVAHSIRNDGLENMGLCKVKGVIPESTPKFVITSKNFPLVWKLEETTTTSEGKSRFVSWQFSDDYYRYQIPADFILKRGYYDRELSSYRLSLASQYVIEHIHDVQRLAEESIPSADVSLDTLANDFSEELFSKNSIADVITLVQNATSSSLSPIGLYFYKSVSTVQDLSPYKATNEDDVAIFLDNAIQSFNSERRRSIASTLIEERRQEYLSSPEKTFNDTQAFNEKYGFDLASRYSQYINQYPKEHVLKDSSGETSKVSIPRGRKFTYRTFLETALRPLLFIEDISASLFFLSQLRSGYMMYGYFLDNEESNVAYYFPELAISFINGKIPDRKFKDCLNHINSLLSTKISSVFKLLKDRIGGGASIESTTNLPKIEDYWAWDEYITPIYKLCKIPRGKELSTSTLVEKYQDIILHYDETKQSFECFNITSILRAIVKDECPVCTLKNKIDRYPESLVDSLRKSREGCIEEMKKTHHHHKVLPGEVKSLQHLLSQTFEGVAIIFVKGLHDYGLGVFRKAVNNIQANKELRKKVTYFYTQYDSSLNVNTLHISKDKIVFVRKDDNSLSTVGVEREISFLLNLKMVRDLVTAMRDTHPKKENVSKRVTRTFSPQFEDEGRKLEAELEELEDLRHRSTDPNSNKGITDKIKNIEYLLRNLATEIVAPGEKIVREEVTEYERPRRSYSPGKLSLGESKVELPTKKKNGKQVKPIRSISGRTTQAIIKRLRFLYDIPPQKKADAFFNPMQRITFRIVRSQKDKDAYISELEKGATEKTEESKRATGATKITLKQQASYIKRLLHLIRHQPIFDEKATMHDKNKYIKQLNKMYKQIKVEANALKKKMRDEGTKTEDTAKLAVLARTNTTIGNSLYQLRMMKIMPELSHELEVIEAKIATSNEDPVFMNHLLERRRRVESAIERITSGTSDTSLDIEEDPSYVKFIILTKKGEHKEMYGKIQSYLPKSAVITAYSTVKSFGVYKSAGRYNVPYQNILVDVEDEEEDIEEAPKKSPVKASSSLDEALGLGPSSSTPIFEDCVFYFSGKIDKKWERIIEENEGMVSQEYTSEVTHVVASTPKNKGLKEQMKDGCWIVGVQYLEDCINQSTRLPEEEYALFKRYLPFPRPENKSNKSHYQHYVDAMRYIAKHLSSVQMRDARLMEMVIVLNRSIDDPKYTSSQKGAKLVLLNYIDELSQK